MRPELRAIQRAALSLFNELSEADALLQLKNQVLQDPEGAFANWLNDTDACTWTGVKCNADEYVENITLPNYCLSGSLVFYWMSALPRLQKLDLSDNDFTGNLSSIEPGSCQSLQVLNLAKNRLSMPALPATLLSVCANIVSLNFSENKISGEIPASFLSRCGALQVLDLSGNKLSGGLPNGVGFCLSLLHLKLDRNSLDGNLPPDFLSNSCSSPGCVTGPSLSSLDLSKNNISGSIPDDLFTNCQALARVDLSSNLLTGSLPSSLQKCKNLTLFNVTANRLFSELPEFLGQMTNIQKLHMASNVFFGQISSTLIGSLAKTLQDLDLSRNNLSGPLPAPFESCKSLQFLKLQDNKFDGDFPSSIFSSLQELEVIRMAFNAFTGSVPVALMNCSRLKVVDFGGNRLTGFVPEELCIVPPSLASNGIKSYVLEQLLLPNNELSGGVPPSLSNCSRLIILNLSFNRLSGTIPSELSYLANLERLSLWYNRLIGHIPSELGNLARLRSLNLNNNLLSGDIPASISRCTNLEWLNLNNNQLTGVIPRELGLLQRLTLLELGNNSLMGVVPQELGNCSQLLWLDLNTNYLSGSIPAAIGRRSTTPLTTSVLSGHQLAFLRNAQSPSACKGFGMGFMVDYTGITAEAIYSSPFTACQIRPTVYAEGVLYDNPENHTLQYLDLSFNRLSGIIPSAMGSWISLIILGLSTNELTGALPSSFSKLRALNVLDISHNQLEGSLAVLSGSSLLVGLDVSNNQFSGEIPGQLSTYPPASFANNAELCGLPLGRCNAPPAHAECSNRTNCPKKSRLGFLSVSTRVVLAVLMATLCMFAFVIWIGFVMKTRNKRKESALLNTLQQSSFHGSSSWNLSGQREPLSINVATFERQLRKLTFSQLIEATNGFSRESLVGTGGFGEVYKAELRDGMVVAIKKLLQFSYQGDREFMAEMETLGRIKHRNLVPLLGYCKVGEERLLVYEYMHGGSLEEVLHGGNKEREKPNWETRKQIAKGAARGLAFLHHNCIPHIIHRDLKSSNVLLDKDLTARVSDFGMARLISALDTHLSVSTLAGTPGYVPPEYYQNFRCTTKGDIYSFGVVLLELVTGKRPTDEFGDNNLVGWVKLHVASNSNVEVLDPSLRSTGAEYEMVQYLKIACDCLDDVPSQRPSMLHVVAVFKEVG
ncbi:hypothetical protein L7F22_009851 [Adiantum nelumboides]|nr:hypothetical protein [Adiantum nelumboides]